MIQKKRFESRTKGISDQIDREISLEWGRINPQTDGETIWLPDKPFPEDDPVWFDHEGVLAAWAHEIAHILFDSDVEAMYDWINTWSNDGDKFNFHDPKGVIESTAEAVIQVVEDHRIEWLYGQLKPGAAIRFRQVQHDNIIDANEIDKSPGTALLLTHCTKWNMEQGDEPNIYGELTDHWGDEMIGFFYERLNEIEDTEHRKTYLIAEQIMQEILPWYEDRIRWVEQNDLDIDSDIEEEKTEKQEKESDMRDLMERIDQIEEDIDEVESEGDWETADDLRDQKQKMKDRERQLREEIEDHEDEIERIEEKIERRMKRSEEEMERLEDITNIEMSLDDEISGDTDIPEEAMDEDLDPTQSDIDMNQMKDQIDEYRKSFDEEIESEPPKDRVDTPIKEIPVKKDPRGTIYHGILNRLERSFSQIHTSNEHIRSQVGDSLDIDAYIDMRIRESYQFDIMQREMSKVGFNVYVIVDLSLSMIKGERLVVSRNIAATLHETFDRLNDRGIDIDFNVIGFGGSVNDDEMMVREPEDPEEVLSMTNYPNYSATPTWRILEYVREKMKEDNDANLMILITDGTPTGNDATGEEMPRGQCLSYTRYQMERCERRGIVPFTIGIRMDLDHQEMKNIYGDYENVESANRAGSTLVDYIENQIYRHLQTLN